MSDHEHAAEPDWSLATFEGASREQLRRWSRLSLEEILRAQEEMQEIARQLGTDPAATKLPDQAQDQGIAAGGEAK